MSNNIIDSFYRTQFFTAALWGAITFVSKMSDGKLSRREVIEEFKNHLGLDELNFPTGSALIAYYRLNEKICKSLKSENKSNDPLLFDSEVISGLEEIQEAINQFIESRKDMYNGTNKK